MLHLSLAKARIQDPIEIGAQNVSAYEFGAYTGEVCAEQLADFEINWVLIGNNDRRSKCGETQDLIN